MSKVATLPVVFGASLLMTAVFLSAVSGFSLQLLVSPHYWVIAVSMTGLFGLAMGDGIGRSSSRRRPALPASGLFPA